MENIEYYPTLCACGCNGKIEIKEYHKYYGIPLYIRGHYNKGKNHTEKARQKIREKRKLQEPPWLGKTRSDSTKQLISEKLKGRRKITKKCQRIECENIVKFNKDKYCSQECYGLSLIGKPSWNTGKTWSEEHRQNLSIIHTGKILSKEHLQNIIKSNSIKPNKAEVSLQYTINSLFFENQFQINVLGNFIIGGKIPDFIDPVNNKIIELYGDYWHKGQDPNDRINYFKDYGYNTLVIWESELKDLKILKNKLIEFTINH